MNLQDAISQIADIRIQMARTRFFRGYRSSTTLFSAAIAILTACAQQLFLPDSAQHPLQYLMIWLSAGVICITVVATKIAIRFWQTGSSLERELTLQAAQQFIPCIVLGGMLTYVLAQTAWDSLWMLPGLWTILFGMGILASRQLLPAPITFVGVFYLLCGLLSITWAKTASPFSPWAMGLPFGIGQTAAAGVLYWKLERSNEPR